MQLPGLGKNRLVEPAPKDVGDALVRELISFVPIVGDLFNLVEFVEATRAGKAELALIYLAQVLPGPPLPLTHLIAYELGKS